MKKVIFVHLLNDYSGSPKVLAQIVECCMSKNHDVELYAGQGGSGFLSDIVKNDHSYFYRRHTLRVLTLVTYIFSQIALFFKLLKYRNQDVLIYVNTMLPFGAGLAGKAMGKPVYYHVHETSLRPAVLKSFLKLVIRLTAKKVVYVSRFVQKEEGFPAIDQVVVHNALSIDFMTTGARNNYTWKNMNSFSVLMVCSLKDYKGVGEFIEVARLCETSSSTSFNLILNAEQPEIEQYFSRVELPKNVVITSRQKDLIPYYSETSLLLNLSRVDEWVETFGLTILEAMAFGIPVVVPPVGGPREIVSHGSEGYLISSYETAEISRVVLDLASNEEKCTSLSRNAKLRAKAFCKERFDRNILALLESDNLS